MKGGAWPPGPTSRGKTMNKRTPLLLFALCFAAAPLAALAESTHCTVITSLPANLSSAGVYCINQDLTLAGSTGSAVFVDADSVTLDLNGHALRSNAAANSATTGVVVVDHKYFTITDGTVAGFAQGISVESVPGGSRSRGGIISDVKVQRSFIFGIGMDCDGCVVRDSLVTDTIVPASITGFSAIGISATGTGNQVSGNRVFDTHTKSGGGLSFAVALSGSNSVAAQNYVANDEILNANEVGISSTGTNNVLIGNQAQGMGVGFFLEDPSTKYRDNTQSGCTSGFNGAAIDLGGNN
jgi:hypothetical protein